MAPCQCWRQAAQLPASSEHHEVLGKAQGLLPGEDPGPNAFLFPEGLILQDAQHLSAHADCRVKSGVGRQEWESEKLDG